MDPTNRIYSIPYNGTDPEWFLQETEKRKQHIDHVYCELPNEEMLSHMSAFCLTGRAAQKKIRMTPKRNGSGT